MARVPSVAQTEPPLRSFSTAVRKLAVTARSCAHCGSPEIRPSNRRNALDVLLACLFLSPFRCKVCRMRFYRVWRPSLIRPPDPPVAPLLVIPARRKVLALDIISPTHIEPEPVLPRHEEPQLIPLGSHAEVNAPQLVENPTSASVPEPPQPLPAVQPGSILILEDDLSIRKLLRRLLDRRGYFTVEISDAADLAAELLERRAGLLIVDISATAENGVKDVAALAAAHPALKILALSAEKLPAIEIPGRLLVLIKPFPLESFVDCVERLLERPC
ncbi:MAG: response regulator [Bryobacteraceae bacterium]